MKRTPRIRSTRSSVYGSNAPGPIIQNFWCAATSKVHKEGTLGITGRLSGTGGDRCGRSQSGGVQTGFGCRHKS